MSKIVSALASDDYKLLIEFNDGSNITYNMQKLVETIPYLRLKDLSSFRAVKFDEKCVYWDVGNEKPEYFPLRISVDAIFLFFKGLSAVTDN